MSVPLFVSLSALMILSMSVSKSKSQSESKSMTLSMSTCMSKCMSKSKPMSKGLFTRSRVAEVLNLAKWGNPPVHIISLYIVIMFTWRLGTSTRRVTSSAVAATPPRWG